MTIAERSAESWDVRAARDLLSAVPRPRTHSTPGDESPGVAVLLLGRSFDEHLDLVEQELAVRRCWTHRVDVDRLTGGGKWPTHLRPIESISFAAGFARSIDIDHALAHHGQRTAYAPESWNDIEPGVRAFAAEQFQRGFLGWLDALQIRHWVNDPWIVPRADLKARQMRVAVGCGLAVPRTVITDDPAEVRSFQAACGGPVVYKGLADPFVTVGPKNATFLYTAALTPTVMDALDELVRYPGIFQERLEPVAEYRVTVVGDDAWVVRVGASGQLDWRRELITGVDYEVVTLDVSVLDAVVATTRGLGLRFAAVDLLETKDAIYFLEVNPDGAYSWLERSLSLPITDHLCDLLLGLTHDGIAQRSVRQEDVRSTGPHPNHPE